MSVLLTIIILYILFFSFIQNTKTSFITEFNEHFVQYCSNLPPITYREEVFIPYENGVYEKPLATALLDISFNTSKANCINILPLPNPPGFNKQLRVEGIEPNGGQKVMFAYIFWSRSLCHASISFTGTELLSEWKSDFQYQQVAPTVLNGYEDGVLVHKGFYNIYITVRDQLWNWWNENSSWVQTLYITGHSLGGGLSTICAYDFAHVLLNSNCPEKFPIHYSFAAPRSGNVKYAELFNKRLPTSLRINNSEDLVPQLPPATWRGYTYEQTRGSIPFTASLGSLAKDHIQAYYDDMPLCAQVADCYVPV